ncbi:aminoglycoside phosphotransferase family protein [Fusibacter paucivorans]|uniref:Aminoglycoside phosphotransferase family protein n=1 Tax=Fusibacter paucivorans TaxID=76009 RepID=A0ABS5PTM1_9FIRM|nr:phosphotransferase [Fusibacter paucivorans]MBS7527387.1 aminoglycoside phosphotransferase family protein [Fusibacter paucivorans]
MNITLKDIEAIFKDRMNINTDSMTACGHHDLKRNLVYKVKSGEHTFIIKFYYKYHKQIRELNALHYYVNTPLKLLAHGIYQGIEWSIYPYITGYVMEGCLQTMPENKKCELFKDFGSKMADFHNAVSFQHFGDWVVGKYSHISAYQTFMINDTERIYHNIEKLNLKPNKLFQEAIGRTRKAYNTIETLDEVTLCHRDLDGRNILIGVNESQSVPDNKATSYQLITFLDFEKCVRFNPHYDIINLYRKYFYKAPALIKPFFEGYDKLRTRGEQYDIAFEFNLLRMGLDIASWSHHVSKCYYDETVDFLETMMTEDLTKWRI